MVSKSPNWAYSPSKWPKWLINGGYYLLTNWDDPPSRRFAMKSLLVKDVKDKVLYIDFVNDSFCISMLSIAQKKNIKSPKTG